MFCSRRGFRQKLVRFIRKTSWYGSWALGLLPFTYDGWTRKLKRSNWLIGYGLILQAVLICLTIMNDTETETPSRMAIFQRNPLAEFINTLHVIFSLATVIFTHIRNYWLSRDLLKIHNELMDIEQEQLSQYILDECKGYDYYVICKGTSFMLEFASMLVVEFGMSPNYTQSFIIGIASLCGIHLGVLLVTMHFHLAVVTIYRYIWIINNELLTSANRLKTGRQVNGIRLNELISVYTRLLELNCRVSGIYDYQMICIMLLFLTANIIGIFFFIVFTISLMQTVYLKQMFILLQALIINIISFWVGIAVCELAEQAGKSTSEVLQLFTEIKEMDKDLENSVNDFAILCSHHRLHFQHCGLFNVNYKMGFRMVIASILYLVWLVQFDFRNL